MAKENTILTIDVGGNSLKMAEFSEQAGSMVLENYAIQEYGGEYAQAEFLDGFAVTYRKMLQENNFTAKSVRISISGQAAFSRLSKLPPLAGQREQLARIIEFEARQTVPYPMDEVAWAYQLIRHSGADAGADPAVSGDELEALYVAVKADLLSIVTDVIQDSGKEILSIEISPTSVFNAAKASQLGENGCDMVLDIGGRSSSLVFVEKGRIFVRSIPIAGDALTQQIAKEFNISFEDAEELKRRHCFIALGGAYEDPDSAVAATISKVARNVMTRLHGEISRSINLWRSQYVGGKPQRMFLCGGSSIIPYTPHFFCEKLRVPVEYLNVFTAVQIGENVDKTKLADAAQLFPPLVGLGLRQFFNCPVLISLMSRSIQKDEALRRRKPFFYASAISAIFCMCLLLFGLQKRTDYDERLLEQSQAKFNSTKSQADKVRNAKSALDGAVGNYNTALAYFDLRDRWTAVMMELERVLPDNMWITYMEPYGSNVDSISTRNTGMGGPDIGPQVIPDMMIIPDNIGAVQRTSVSNINLAPSKITGMDGVEWLVIEGHALVLERGVPPQTVLQNNLADSEIFSGGDSDSFVSEYTYEPDGSMNLTAFRIKLRLKEPIDQQ